MSAAVLRGVSSCAVVAARGASRRLASTSSTGLDGLDPYLRGSSSSSGAQRKPYMSHVDGVRAEALLRARVHLGHQRRRTNAYATGHLHGFRHNVAIYDVAKTWRSMRTLFHAFAEMAAARSAFFLLAPNPHLPLGALVERMRAEYPFRHDRFASLYMTGYSDVKWIDGVFSNWKVTWEYAAHVKRVLADKPASGKFRKLARHLKGIAGEDVYAKIVPDFVLVLATDRGALAEIRNADVPLVGLCDSDADPRAFLYPVFANDDALESLQFVLDLIARGVEEGRKREQEAFALLLIRKVKQHLDPASGAATALLTPPPDYDAGSDDDAAEAVEGGASERDPWLPKLDAVLPRPDWLNALDAATGGVRLDELSPVARGAAKRSSSGSSGVLRQK